MTNNFILNNFLVLFSSTMDCIIFLYLGMALLDLRVAERNFWFLGFIVWTLVLCLLVRFLGVYLLTYFTNRFRRVLSIMDF